jgi:hypothetical protein
MKTLLAASILLALSAPAFAQTIAAEDAPDHVGQSVTVVGRASVEEMPSGEIHLDLAGSGEGAPVSGYISRLNANSFWDLARLDGQLVAMRGELAVFRGQPEIFLTSQSQLAIVDQPPPAQASAEPAASIKPRWIHIPPRRR